MEKEKREREERMQKELEEQERKFVEEQLRLAREKRERMEKEANKPVNKEQTSPRQKTSDTDKQSPRNNNNPPPAKQDQPTKQGAEKSEITSLNALIGDLKRELQDLKNEKQALQNQVEAEAKKNSKLQEKLELAKQKELEESFALEEVIGNQQQQEIAALREENSRLKTEIESLTPLRDINIQLEKKVQRQLEQIEELMNEKTAAVGEMRVIFLVFVLTVISNV